MINGQYNQHFFLAGWDEADIRVFLNFDNDCKLVSEIKLVVSFLQWHSLSSFRTRRYCERNHTVPLLRLSGIFFGLFLEEF